MCYRNPDRASKGALLPWKERQTICKIHFIMKRNVEFLVQYSRETLHNILLQKQVPILISRRKKTSKETLDRHWIVIWHHNSMSQLILHWDFQTRYVVSCSHYVESNRMFNMSRIALWTCSVGLRLAATSHVSSRFMIVVFALYICTYIDCTLLRMWHTVMTNGKIDYFNFILNVTIHIILISVL